MISCGNWQGAIGLTVLQQMYHVKEFPYPVPGNLDLNIADEEEFSPDKLRSNLERLYMTVVCTPRRQALQCVSR